MLNKIRKALADDGRTEPLTWQRMELRGGRLVVVAAGTLTR